MTFDLQAEEGLLPLKSVDLCLDCCHKREKEERKLEQKDGGGLKVTSVTCTYLLLQIEEVATFVYVTTVCKQQV